MTFKHGYRDDSYLAVSFSPERPLATTQSAIRSIAFIASTPRRGIDREYFGRISLREKEEYLKFSQSQLVNIARIPGRRSIVSIYLEGEEAPYSIAIRQSSWADPKIDPISNKSPHEVSSSSSSAVPKRPATSKKSAAAAAQG